MKRRNKSWLIAALVALSAVMVLTGCSLSQVLSLTIVDYPATTYEVGTTPDIEFTVAAEMDNGDTKTLTYNEYSSVLKLSGFSTEEVGTFTATVTYRNVSATFDYEVVDGSEDFAGGVGTETNPYIINTAAQFLKIGNAGYEGKYFKLNADIDMAGVEATGDNSFAGEDIALVETFRGILDGNGYKLVNCESGKAVFSELIDATIQDIDIYTIGNVNLAFDSYGDVSLINVDRYGEMMMRGESNVSAYITYVNSGNFRMENCNNYVNIKGAAAYASAFIAIPWLPAGSTTKIDMVNCINYGEISGQRAAVMFANAYKMDRTGITLTDCSNEGKVFGIEEAEFYFAISSTEERVGYIEDNNKEINQTKNISLAAPLEGLEATVDETGKITVKNENSAYVNVVVRGYFYANRWDRNASGALVESGTLLQNKDEILSFTESTTVSAKEIALHKIINSSTITEGRNDSTAGNNLESWTPDFESQTYYFGYENGNSVYKLNNDGATVSVIVLVFDAEGELIGGCVPTASN